MIPEKANRVLNCILLLMALVVLRVWHLSVVQYESKVEEARKPQRRLVVEAARRATIRDRFNLPLAINKVQYNAAILYSQLRQIPTVSWTTDPSGNRIKRYKRKEYVSALAKLLAEELHLDSERLEDLIYSKAALYYNIPFVIKEELSEQEYYRLKMLERDWLGIHVQRLPRRTYPRGRVAADIIGYMGAINRQEYEAIIHEIKTLEYYLEQREAGEDIALPENIASPAEARRRLKELQDLAYTANDYVGKAGIEGRFEQELRGFQGRRSYYSDARGNFLRELPGARDPIAGRRFLLTISSELQEYAEQLLMQNERIREAHISHADTAHSSQPQKQPWIKGGAIIVMDPFTGEVLTMASYPRVNPNDYIAAGNPEQREQQLASVVRWLESEEYIGQIWDQKRPLERERFDDDREIAFDEGEKLTWERYLEAILPNDSPVRKAFKQGATIEDAIVLQRAFTGLLQASGQDSAYGLLQVLYPREPHVPYGKRVSAEARGVIEEHLQKLPLEVAAWRQIVDPIFDLIPQHYDKILLVDLCRLAVGDHLFTAEVLAVAGNQDLALYRDVSAALAQLDPIVRTMTKAQFQEHHFKQWRQQNEKPFLKVKRAEEKLLGKYPKPYIDYFDQEETKQFEQFWQTHHWELLLAFLQGHNPVNPYSKSLATWFCEIEAGAHQGVSWLPAYHTLQRALPKHNPSIAIDYLKTLRNFHSLDRPLLGHYRRLRKPQEPQYERQLAAAFYPVYGYGYGRSYAYRQAAVQGSLFKLVTAYTALTQRYNQLGEEHPSMYALNPLKMVELQERRGNATYMGTTADSTPIPQNYKGGRLIKSAIQGIGKLDILRAIEMSSNPYFSILAGDVIESPDDLTQAARAFSYGRRTGIDLPGEIAGKIPDDLHTNRTGLYAFAIGQHSLVVTPLQASVMLSAIANGGKVLQPKIVSLTAGNTYRGEPIPCLPHFEYQDSLVSVGIDFPLFTASILQDQHQQVEQVPTHVWRELFMPAIVRSTLIEGMNRVVDRMQHGTGLSGLSRFYQDYPEAISDYLELHGQLTGKTSTAEAMEQIDLDPLHGSNMYTHVWFGGMTFDPVSDTRQTFLVRDAQGRPELVVVVYLRFGRFGREAAPVAAQVVKRWRAIKQQHKS